MVNSGVRHFQEAGAKRAARGPRLAVERFLPPRQNIPGDPGVVFPMKRMVAALAAALAIAAACAEQDPVVDPEKTRADTAEPGDPGTAGGRAAEGETEADPAGARDDRDN